MNSVTRSLETSAPPDAILSVLRDIRRLPDWAPGFAERVMETNDGNWLVIKGERQFVVAVLVHEKSGTIDYVRELSSGRTGGAYFRVLPGPVAGSIIIATLPVPLGSTEVDAISIADSELEGLVRLVPK